MGAFCKFAQFKNCGVNCGVRARVRIMDRVRVSAVQFIDL